MKSTDLNISEIQRIVNLIQKVDCQNYALITDTAKELGIKKTALMQYIEDNPKLFKLVEVVKPKPKGLAISVVFTDPANNPVTEEWLTKMKDEWKNKLYIAGKYYYGYLEFLYIDVDDKDNRRNEWRNTPEKIQTLIDAGLIKKQTRCVGGLGDCYNWEGYIIDLDTRKALEDAGWELDCPSKD